MKKAFAAAVLATALLVGVAAQPAPAVVHEIYAAWCAGKGEIVPPGIAREGSKNFAMPVLKSGAVSVHPIPAGIWGPSFRCTTLPKASTPQPHCARHTLNWSGG